MSTLLLSSGPPSAGHHAQHEVKRRSPVGTLGHEKLTQDRQAKKYLGGDGKPKRMVRTIHGSLEHRAVEGDIWKPAASLLGSYDNPRERGANPNDVTSYLAIQKEWGPDRDVHWPKIEGNVLHRFERNDYPIPEYTPEVWYDTGRIVLDLDNNPILKYEIIPATLSSELSGRDMEAIKRLDLRISRKDFRARMPSTIMAGGKNKKNLGVPIEGNFSPGLVPEHSRMPSEKSEVPKRRRECKTRADDNEQKKQMKIKSGVKRMRDEVPLEAGEILQQGKRLRTAVALPASQATVDFASPERSAHFSDPSSQLDPRLVYPAPPLVGSKRSHDKFSSDYGENLVRSSKRHKAKMVHDQSAMTMGGSGSYEAQEQYSQWIDSRIATEVRVWVAQMEKEHCEKNIGGPYRGQS
ncbi:hypothetical protein MMC22_010395 [Lobaria immixta]|nr:hypothetical protein [Lobaria immixta]